MARTVVSTDNSITIKHYSAGARRKVKSFSKIKKVKKEKRYG